MAICRWLFFVGILSRCTSCLFRTACIFWHRCFMLVILRGIRSAPLQSSVWVFSALCLGNTTKRSSNRIRSLQEQSAFWTYYFALLIICHKSLSNPSLTRRYNKTQTKPMLCLGFGICGERGIRTLGERKPSTVFKTAAFDHSAISPLFNYQNVAAL